MLFVMVYVSFDMILGAYLLGNMTALIVKGSRTEQFRDKMAELIGYMNKNNLGKHISNEVKDHLRLQYSHKHADSTVLQDIPNSIRTKVFPMVTTTTYWILLGFFFQSASLID